MKETTKGYLFGLMAAIFWGPHAVMVRYLTSSVSWMSIAFIRLFIASIVLFLFLKFSKRKKKIDWKIENKKWFLLVVFFGMFLNFVVFHWGLEYTTASNAMLLENTAPIFVLVFLAIFMKEKITKLDVLAVVATFIGVAVLVLKWGDVGVFSTSEMFGNLLEIGAAASFAIFIIGSSKVFADTNDTRERLTNLLKVFIATAILLSPSLLFTQFSLSLNDLIILISLGVFPTALAYWFWYEAAARISTIASALMFNLTIVFTFITAYIFLGEQITLKMLIGAALILVGITVTKLKD